MSNNKLSMTKMEQAVQESKKFNLIRDDENTYSHPNVISTRMRYFRPELGNATFSENFYFRKNEN